VILLSPGEPSWRARRYRRRDNGQVMLQEVMRHAVPRARRPKSRKLRERVAVRMPRVAAQIRAAVLSLSPRSPLRRALLPCAIADGYEALNREDWDVIRGMYAARAVVQLVGFEEGPLQVPDAEELQLGPDGVVRFAKSWREPWDEFHAKPREVVDLGDRTLVLVDAFARGRASGVEVRQPVADLATWRGGRIVRMEHYWRHEQALQAIGLPS
jgi:ketosteroid isomerase-like protein